jgi:hypothetical protein
MTTPYLVSYGPANKKAPNACKSAAHVMNKSYSLHPYFLRRIALQSIHILAHVTQFDLKQTPTIIFYKKLPNSSSSPSGARPHVFDATVKRGKQLVVDQYVSETWQHRHNGSTFKLDAVHSSI